MTISLDLCVFMSTCFILVKGKGSGINEFYNGLRAGSFLEQQLFVGDFDEDCFSHRLHVLGFEVELIQATGKVVAELAGEDSAIAAVVLLRHLVRPGFGCPVRREL